MKRLIMLATVVVTLMTLTSGAHAAGRQTTTADQQTTTASQQVTTVSKSQRVGFFAKLMELERRKNAAIRRFFGWE